MTCPASHGVAGDNHFTLRHFTLRKFGRALVLGGHNMKNPNRTSRLLAILLGLGLVAAACGSTADTATEAVAEVAEEATGGDDAAEEEAPAEE